MVFSVDEMAEALGVDRATVHQLIRTGDVRVARPRSRIARVIQALMNLVRSKEETGRRNGRYIALAAPWQGSGNCAANNACLESRITAN